MSEPTHSPTPSKALQMELVISELLAWGVKGSLALLVLGTVLCFLRGDVYGTGGGTAADLHRLITAEHGVPGGLAWLCWGMLHLDGSAIVVAGLLLLIATPVLRVLVSIVAFAVEKDRAYVAYTAIVFLLLVLSFVLGKAG